MDFEAYEGEVTYNLSEEYSMLRLKVAASERANTEDMILTVKLKPKFVDEEIPDETTEKDKRK